MHDYPGILKRAEGTQLRVYPGLSTITYRQLLSLSVMEGLINDHLASVACQIQSDFFLREIVNDMVENDYDYLEFPPTTKPSDIYGRMVASGVISYGQRVEVLLINGSIIFKISPGNTDITATNRLDIYIQRIGIEEKLPALCPNIDQIKTSLRALADLFTYRMIELDHQYHVVDLKDVLGMSIKLRPHYLDIIHGLNIDPQAWLKNPKWSQEIANIASIPYGELDIKHNLPALAYPLAYRAEAMWAFDLKYTESIVTQVTISEPEILAEWHEHAVAVSRCIAFNNAKNNIVVPYELRLDQQ